MGLQWNQSILFIIAGYGKPKKWVRRSRNRNTPWVLYLFIMLFSWVQVGNVGDWQHRKQVGINRKQLWFNEHKELTDILCVNTVFNQQIILNPPFTLI